MLVSPTWVAFVACQAIRAQADQPSPCSPIKGLICLVSLLMKGVVARAVWRPRSGCERAER